MNIFIDIQRQRNLDGMAFGNTIMWFNEMPKKGDIISNLYIPELHIKNNPELGKIPEGPYEILCDPFELATNPQQCSHKIMVYYMSENI